MKFRLFILGLFAFLILSGSGCTIFGGGHRGGKKDKHGFYKRKKGLFGGKKECDCPKH